MKDPDGLSTVHGSLIRQKVHTGKTVPAEKILSGEKSNGTKTAFVCTGVQKTFNNNFLSDGRGSAY